MNREITECGPITVYRGRPAWPPLQPREQGGPQIELWERERFDPKVLVSGVVCDVCNEDITTFPVTIIDAFAHCPECLTKGQLSTRGDPRYAALTFDSACAVVANFNEGFNEASDTEEVDAAQVLALELYVIALDWLVDNDRWREAGIDPEIAACIAHAAKTRVPA